MHGQTSYMDTSLITASSIDLSAQQAQDGHASLHIALCRCISLLYMRLSRRPTCNVCCRSK